MAEGYRFDDKKISNQNSNESRRDSSYLSLRNAEDMSNWTHYPHTDEASMDLSYLNLDGMTLHQNLELLKPIEDNNSQKKDIHFLFLQHNRLDFIPANINKFWNLKHIDLSNNFLSEINEAIFELKQLNILIVRNNLLGDFSLPKKLGILEHLQELNLSGNLFRTIPPEIVDLSNLKSLHMGGNQLEELPRDIWRLEKLEVLYLGGNRLRDIPAEMGRLHQLRSLILCENQLQSLPSSISCLRRLRSLSLHKNQLTTLPPEIVTLKGLVELSLRDNPLVVRFVQDMTYDPPSLRELAARTVKLFRIPYKKRDLPPGLIDYLNCACRCVNPKCRGVYFDVRVEHIKFVDFCGKYRIPLLQYLCSPRCGNTSSASHSDVTSSDDDSDVPHSRLRRVLLG
ncbi:leucine-rich repeat-containing protein 58-like [Argiope bruennichi]|uniref:Leucine-rich repeat and death domain-containing protein 1 n=1 Tax=Argiope bruennichi TaxID=94029 RepID=A0A8T0E5S2_ARGBR|nr:leucine-rich repeat-containing protein 58-like [Argiope bruennichi]KAF8765201.1 Leucine-rich repeat-containing protein 58 [Argiope bruennichi]